MNLAFEASTDGSAFQILDAIDTNGDFAIHHARSTQTGVAAVVKVLDPAARSADRVASFKREYELLQRLNVPGVAKPVSFVDEPRQLAIVLDDLAGESLEAVLSRQRLDLTTCLRLACQLARILSGLHAAHVVHRDIRPANLMLLAGGEVCLVDVRLATSEATETTTASNPAVGDWAYVSPEQTGRMNHAVDLRTDFYSLGVTLYRMVTGQLPHRGSDALELVHCHIARLPCPACEVNADIPPVLSAIVMKLLAKMPEERYQHADGLLHDLENCLAQWESLGAVEPFALGAQDWSEGLKASQQLVGRAAEINRALASFDAVAAAGRAALLLVSGDAGVGKTALVHALYRPVMARRAYFISGKFDQYQRDIPYATVTQAFRELVQQILAESETRIAVWREQIQAAVGGNGQLIVDVLPQIALIVGPQEPVPELPAAEAQNRFRIVFKQFIGVFAQAAHPLILFLDDLQWADTGSLRLVSELVSSLDRRFLLVAGAYRDKEVGPGHPLLLALDQMRSESAVVTQVALAALPEAAVCTLLGDMLHCEAGAAAPLARLVHEKTAGNPFFVTQFVKALAEERLLAFDAASRRWRWDLAEIDAKGYTDNVAELMIGKLSRLPQETQAVLQRLACLGAGTAQDALTTVCAHPEALTRAALSAAVSAGLVVRAGGTVTFTHDRV
ncbi:MAG: AAA family ATPase, partial [Pseudomonadota bacterium]|nr:AAA family ATPase [Pseudomonadota bacterium]